MAFLLSQLLEASAGRDPGHEAVSFDGATMSYGELDAQSNSLARCLQRAGVGREDRVCILMEKSIQFVVSIFGILKAGAAYVPLDAGAPPARLNYIVRNSGARAMVASGRHRTLAEVVEGCEELQAVICHTAEPNLPMPVIGWQTALSEDPGSVVARAIENDLAYILYTSGSTGQPKGVRISHRNALAFVDWAAETFALTPDDRVSNHAPFHFDLSIFDLFSTVKAGATICPVPSETAKFPVELGRFFEQERISVWYSVPSALILLLERGKLDSRDLSRLRTVLFAGEVFPSKHLKALMELAPRPRYFNLYGPTETNVITWYEVTEPPQGPQPVPIGRACANADSFILDDDGSVVREPGREGELYGRGPTVALGYHGDRERTERSFVRDPLRPDSPHRVYRTGDRVSLDAGGNYVFHGRYDFQVKVNGYRVELGEIETTILAHQTVREVAVIAASDEQSSDYLHAFVVAGSGALTGEEIRRYCGLSLPPYMVPGQVTFLGSLPRTPNGKIDRISLRSRS